MSAGNNLTNLIPQGGGDGIGAVNAGTPDTLPKYDAEGDNLEDSILRQSGNDIIVDTGGGIDLTLDTSLVASTPKTQRHPNVSGEIMVFQDTETPTAGNHVVQGSTTGELVNSWLEESGNILTADTTSRYLKFRQYIAHGSNTGIDYGAASNFIDFYIDDGTLDKVATLNKTNLWLENGVKLRMDAAGGPSCNIDADSMTTGRSQSWSDGSGDIPIVTATAGGGAVTNDTTLTVVIGTTTYEINANAV